MLPAVAVSPVYAGPARLSPGIYPSASRAPAPSRPAVLNRARFPVSRGRFIGF